MIGRFIEFLQKVDLELGVKDVLEIEDIFDILWLALQLNSPSHKIGRSYKADGAKRIQDTLQVPPEQDSKKPIESSQSSASNLSQRPSVPEESMSTGLHFP